MYGTTNRIEIFILYYRVMNIDCWSMRFSHSSQRDLVKYSCYILCKLLIIFPFLQSEKISKEISSNLLLFSQPYLQRLWWSQWFRPRRQVLLLVNQAGALYQFETSTNCSFKILYVGNTFTRKIQKPAAAEILNHIPYQLFNGTCDILDDSWYSRTNFKSSFYNIWCFFCCFCYIASKRLELKRIWRFR